MLLRLLCRDPMDGPYTALFPSLATFEKFSNIVVDLDVPIIVLISTNTPINKTTTEETTIATIPPVFRSIVYLELRIFKMGTPILNLPIRPICAVTQPLPGNRVTRMKITPICII